MRARWGMAAIFVVAATVALFAVPALLERATVAHAEELRTRCVKGFSTKRAWRAELVVTERGSDGERASQVQQLVVRGPGQYRLVVRERDGRGREVVSTTVRTGSTMRTVRTLGDGSTELHLVSGMRPVLSLGRDNLLGQTVEAVASTRALKVVGSGSHGGRPTDRLALGADRFVWVDRETGLPVEEQVVSNGEVVHSVQVRHFEDDAAISDAEFAAATVSGARALIEEDLGFREVAGPADASIALGFTPRSVDPSAGLAVRLQGYVDPTVTIGDGPAEGAFVVALAGSRGEAIVTQVARDDAAGTVAAALGGADDGRGVLVAGQPAVVFDEAGLVRLVFAREGLLVTVETDLGEAEAISLAEGVR